MSKTRTLGTWLRRYLAEHIVTERNLARNTPRRATATPSPSSSPSSAPGSARPSIGSQFRTSRPGAYGQFLDHLEDDRGCSVQTRKPTALSDPRLRALRRQPRSQPSRMERQHPCDHLEKGHAAAHRLAHQDRDGRPDRGSRHPDAERPRGIRPPLLFLYNTGARVSEATALVVGDLQIGRGKDQHALVHILGKGGRHTAVSTLAADRRRTRTAPARTGR